MIMDDQIQADNSDPSRIGEGQQLLGISILDLKFRSCRYVIRQNEDGEHFFCGEVIHRVSYCIGHYRACYVKTKPIRL